MAYYTFCRVCGERRMTWQGNQGKPVTCQKCRRAARVDTLCMDCGVPVSRGSKRCRRCHNVNNNGLKNPPRVYRTCPTCGVTFWRKKAGHDSATYCSHPCAMQAQRKEPKPKASRVAFKDCQHCGTLFTAHPVSRVYCTVACRVQANIDRSGKKLTDLYRLACQLGINGAMWRRNMVAWFRERDGDLCYLCWARIDFSVKSGPSGSDLGYSIEHIVPASHFAQDDPMKDHPDNLALSHWGCNRDRKTAPITILHRAAA